MRVSRRTKSRLLVDLTTEDLRSLVFGIARTYVEGADEFLDPQEDTIYIQIAESGGIQDELGDDLDEVSDYNLTPLCRDDAVQVRFIIAAESEDEEQALDDLPMPTATPTVAPKVVPSTPAAPAAAPATPPERPLIRRRR